MSRPETKQRIPHMLMDTDFYEKPENLEAIDRFGDAAPSCIQRICFKLMNEEGARMKRSQVIAMWRSTSNTQDVWAAMVDYYIKCGWLFVDGDYLSSNRAQQERQRVVQKRSILSANAKQKLSKSSARQEQQTSKSSDTDTVTDTGSDLGSKDLDPKKNGTAFTPSGKYDTPTIRKFLPLLQEKLARVNRGFGEIEFEALVMRLGCDVQRIEAAIVHTCSLTEPRNVCEPSAASNGPPKKLTNADRVRKFVEENSDGSGKSFESHGLDSAGIWGPVRPLPGAAGSVDGDTSASRLRSSSGGNGSTTSPPVSVPATSRRGTGGGA